MSEWIGDTGLESDQDHDYGNDGNPGQGFYNSLIELTPNTLEVPETGTFSLLICTTKDRLLEMLSTIRTGAITRELPPVADYNIDLLKALEALNNPELAECFEGGIMTCENVADCIETDETVQNAITNTVNEAGFQYDSETIEEPPPPSITNSAKSKNLLPATLACEFENQPQVMGLARAIVQELHQCAEDLFELVEFATNSAEAAAGAAEAIPFAKPAATFLNFVDWVIETMMEAYQASYNQSSEDELACMIFCHIMANCSLSLDDLTQLYEAKGAITLPPPDDLAAVLAFAIEFDFSALDTTVVAVFHYQILRMMSWGSVGGFSYQYLSMLIQSNVSAHDYTYDDLCDCAESGDPTTYWMLYFDYRKGTYTTTATNATVPAGMHTDRGWVYNPGISQTTTNANFVYPDFGANYVIRAAGTRSLRRGSSGNGTHDYSNVVMYTGINKTGTSFSFGQTGLTFNDNKVTAGQISPLHATTYRSFEGRNRTGIAPNAGGDVRVYETVVWGLAGAGNTKPPHAVWAGNTLPSTIPELFPT